MEWNFYMAWPSCWQVRKIKITIRMVACKLTHALGYLLKISLNLFNTCWEICDHTSCHTHTHTHTHTHIHHKNMTFNCRNKTEGSFSPRVCCNPNKQTGNTVLRLLFNRLYKQPNHLPETRERTATTPNQNLAILAKTLGHWLSSDLTRPAVFANSTANLRLRPSRAGRK